MNSVVRLTRAQQSELRTRLLAIDLSKVQMPEIITLQDGTRVDRHSYARYIIKFFNDDVSTECVLH